MPSGQDIFQQGEAATTGPFAGALAPACIPARHDLTTVVKRDDVLGVQIIWNSDRPDFDDRTIQLQQIALSGRHCCLRYDYITPNTVHLIPYWGDRSRTEFGAVSAPEANRPFVT
jgi:hypothetical protein